MKISAYFEPRDLWIGLFWTRKPVLFMRPRLAPEGGTVWRSEERLHLYFCLVPTLVIKVVL